jgi:hypothetical protein
MTRSKASIYFREHFSFGARCEKIGKNREKGSKDGKKQRRDEGEIDEGSGGGD